MAGQPVVIELAPSEAGGLELRGAARELWRCTAHEQMLSGPAESGKTVPWCHKLHALMWAFPGCQLVMARKLLVDLYPSVFQTWLRVTKSRTDNPAGQYLRYYGGAKPEWVSLPNGSRLWLAGLDHPGKALSSERDGVYINQAEEVALEDWETLLTRTTGRGAVMPWTFVGGDCNPGPPTHWILDRFQPSNPVPGRVFLESRHEDNPALFHADGTITEQGRRSLAILDGLTGTRKERLRHGRWAQAEGVVYEGWDPGVHLVDPFPIPDDWPRYRAIDFGYINPFVCLWGATDPDGRLYIYRELYGTRRLVEEWADGRRGSEMVNPHNIWSLSSGERYRATVRDHDAGEGAILESRGIPTVPAYKAVREGIQAVAARLTVQPDGKPRLMVFRGARVNPPDPHLMQDRKPTCTADEFPGYVWHTKGGQDRHEEPLKEDDHGCDAARYLVAHLDGLGEPDVKPRVNPLDHLKGWKRS